MIADVVWKFVMFSLQHLNYEKKNLLLKNLYSGKEVSPYSHRIYTKAFSVAFSSLGMIFSP